MFAHHFNSQIMRKILILFLFPLQIMAQDVPKSVDFWNTLKEHCGKSYEGKISIRAKKGDGFTGEKLVMHVRSCEENTIRIPFFVGTDKSRTWVFININIAFVFPLSPKKKQSVILTS